MRSAASVDPKGGAQGQRLSSSLSCGLSALTDGVEAILVTPVMGQTPLHLSTHTEILSRLAGCSAVIKASATKQGFPRLSRRTRTLEGETTPRLLARTYRRCRSHTHNRYKLVKRTFFSKYKIVFLMRKAFTTNCLLVSGETKGSLKARQPALEVLRHALLQAPGLPLRE